MELPFTRCCWCERRPGRRSRHRYASRGVSGVFAEDLPWRRFFPLEAVDDQQGAAIRNVERGALKTEVERDDFGEGAGMASGGAGVTFSAHNVLGIACLF